MKTIIAAAIATLAITGAAHATDVNLDNEPTASIAGLAFDGQVFRGDAWINGREYVQRFTLNTDGTMNVLSQSPKSSSSR